MQPGIYNLNTANYHADPAPTPSLSSSIANVILNQSPLHALLAHPRLNPLFKREPSTRFDLGSAAHLMLLEPERDNIVVVDADDWRTKAAKEQRDQAQANGQYAILARQYEEVSVMVDRAKAYIATTELAGIFETGDPERTVLWQEGDIWCRARPDLMSEDKRIVLDYKTTESAAPDVFARQIGRMGYDLQAEFYTRGMASVGHEVTFVFLVQEISAPYACSLISLSAAYREVGQLKVRRALDLWTKALIGNEWGAYTPKILYAEPKPWDLLQAEELNTQEDET